MRKSVLLLASTAIALLLASGTAVAEVKLDQRNTGPITSVRDYEEFNSDTQYVAQVVTAGKTGELSKVSVLIEKGTCSGGSLDPQYKDINVRIYSIGTYSWTLKASTIIPASQVPNRPCWPSTPPPLWTDVTFDPGNRPQVYARAQYAIALEPGPDDPYISDPTNYHWYYNGGSYYYTGGDGYYRVPPPYPQSGYARIGSLDFLFKTYVDVPDTDGDGLANDVDQCDTEPGPASNNGCPVLLDTVSPTGSVEINGGARITSSRTVRLALQAIDPSPGTRVVSMRVKNAGSDWTAWQAYAKRKDWRLTRGEGKKTVYVQYKDGAGNASAWVSDSIIYRP